MVTGIFLGGELYVLRKLWIFSLQFFFLLDKLKKVNDLQHVFLSTGLNFLYQIFTLGFCNTF